jgi:hypothetical protein
VIAGTSPVRDGLKPIASIAIGRTGMRDFYEYGWRTLASPQIVLIILAIMAALLAMAPLELQRHKYRSPGAAAGNTLEKATAG